MGNADEEDDLPVPARPLRLVIGLTLMTVGSCIGLIGVRPWLSLLGWATFIVSFPIMLKARDRQI